MASNKTFWRVYLLAGLLCGSAYAETGVVSAVGIGRDTPEAITNLLKTTVGKYFRDRPAALSRNILQSEILPNASSFVQSYKVLEGSKAGAVHVSANVDLDVIHGLMALSPKSLGETEGAKAVVLVRGAKLPDSLFSTLKPGATPPDPFASLALGARERLARRDFAEATVSTEDMQAMGAGEDISSPELLRGLGAKADARIALGIMGKFETFENENSHNKEERLVISATMVDVKAGNIIARTSVNVVNPKSRKDQYLADLQRNIFEESKDLFQDILVAAGRKMAKPEGHSEISVLRVLFPSNNTLVLKFKTLLETVPGVRSVTEFSIRRGKYDYAVRPALTEAALAKAISGLQSPDISILVVKSLADEPEAHPPTLTVKLAPKEESLPATPGAEGVPPNAKH